MANIDIVINAKDNASRVVSGAAEIMTGAFRRVGEMATNALASAGQAFANLAGEAVRGNAEFERYETQFGVLLGSVDAAKDRLAELAEFGAKTPFELPEVVRADKILQAFGLHAEDTAARFGFAGTEIRTIAGDVAAGTGASFEEISTYLGKFASGATGEAISRMQELGIVTRQQLAEMGLEFSKSGELLTPVDEAMDVLLGAMKEKFGGMMDAQSGTFEGMMSNFEDFRAAAIRTIGAPIFDVAKNALGKMLEFLNSDEAQAGIKGLSESLGALARGVSSVIMSLAGGEIGDAGYAVFELFDKFFGKTAGMQAEQFFYGIVDAITAFVGFVQDNIPLVQQTFGVVFAEIQNIFGAVSGFVTGVLMPAIASIWEQSGAQLPTAQAVFESVMAAIQTAVTVASDVIVNYIIPALTTIVDWVVANWPTIQATIQTVMTAIQTVIQTVLTAVQTFWAQWGDEIMAVINFFVEQYQTIFAAFSQAFEGNWRGFGETLRVAWDNAWQAIQQIAQAAIDWFGSVDWAAIGTAILEGIANGIKAGADMVVQAAKDAAAAALEATKGFLGIESPSRAFAQLGLQSMAGFAEGISGASNLPAMAAVGAAGSAYYSTQSVTMNINGSGNPQAVAAEVRRQLDASGRSADGRIRMR